MIVLLIHNYYKSRGGEDTAYDWQKRILKENGHDIIEYSNNSKDIDNIFKRSYAFLNSFYSHKTYRDLKEIILEKKPDIAHIHNIYPLITRSVYDVLSDNYIPIVQTIHNYRFFCANGLCLNKGEICNKCENLSIGNIFHNCSDSQKLYNFLLALNIYILRKKDIYLKVSNFIALSNFVKKKLVKVGIDKAKISVIKNILENKAIDIISEDTEKKYFVYLGRLSQEKGIQKLVKVFTDLKKVKLKILGDGPLYENIKNKITSQKISNISLLGYIDGEEKYKTIKSAYAVVIPSICYEVSPMVIAESFKLGIPVIVSNIGSLPENIVDGKNGYIYNDLHKLKNIILKVASLDKRKVKKIAANCISSYRKIFDSNYNFDLLIDLYKSILSSKKC